MSTSNKLVPAVKVSRGNPVPAVKVGGKNKNMPLVIPPGKSLIDIHQDDDDPFQNDYLSVTKPITPILLPQNLLELGLVDKTYIKIEYYNDSQKNIIIDFGRPKKYNATCIKPLYVTPTNPQNSSEVGIKFRSSNNFLGEGIYYNADIWGDAYKFDPECFKHIKLRVDRGHMKLKRFRIVLNNIDILHYIMTPPMVISTNGFDFTDLIMETKHNILLNYLDHESSDIQGVLLRASNDLGSGYRWGYNFDDADPHYEGWCCDFAAYIINKCTNFNLSSITGLWEFFDNNNKSITPATFLYKNLGNIVKPGYLVRVGNNTDYVGNHCTLFVRWGKIKAQSHKFDPNNHINYFVGLGGSQNKKVSFLSFSVTDDFSWVSRNLGIDEANRISIVWDENDPHSDGRRICRTDKSKNNGPLTQNILLKSIT